MAGVRRLNRRAVSVLAVISGVLGAALLWVALSGSSSSPPVPGAVPTGSGRPESQQRAVDRIDAPALSPPGRGTHSKAGGVPDPVAGLLLDESIPVSITIPRLGVQSNLVRLGLDPTGEMEVPSDPQMAGWYDRGPTPGALGPAVIAGHVTWNLEPAVFFRLGELRSGDHVQVARRDGVTAVFTVVRVARFTKSSFPTKAVFGATDYASLRLITCGGTYDESTHQYLDNVVVFSKLERVHSNIR